MATLEQENQIRNKLKITLDEFAAINADDLVRPELGRDLNFESGVPFFSRTLRLLHALAEADLTDVSYEKLTQLDQVATQQRSYFRQIQEFSVRNTNNPVGSRDQFINAIRDNYGSLFESVAPVIAFTIRKGTDFARLEEQGKAVLKRMEENTKKQEEAMQASSRMVQEAVDAVRKAVQEVGVSQHMIHFTNEANKYEQTAKTWLIATVVLAAFTAVVGLAMFAFYFWHLSSFSAAQNLQLAISKIVIFSLFFTATLWAGRTYRAQSHNAVVNRHRQNALATFQAFAKAASDTETKNAVLIQATQCIFSPQPTGHIGSESESGGMGHVLEIVRDLSKSK